MSMYSKQFIKQSPNSFGNLQHNSTQEQNKQNAMLHS